MPKRPDDRDLLTLILAFTVSVGIGTLDALADLESSSVQGFLNSAMIFGAVVLFYTIGRSS